VIPALALMMAVFLAQPGANVTVKVTGVTKPGRIFVALCDKDHFMNPACPIQKSAAPSGREAALTFNDVAPGRYAVMVFQDVNGNGKIDLGLMFVPKEPWGISGPKVAIPSFARNAILVGDGPLSIDIALRN